jgi:hypothetical protein
MSRAGVVLVLAVAACRPAVPFQLAGEQEHGTVTRLRLVGAPGARINARLKPALELADGTVLRFDSPHVTADSAYFVDAPAVEAPRGGTVHTGIVRASVCSAGEKLCRTFALAVRF